MSSVEADDKSITITFDSEAIRMINDTSAGLLKELEEIKAESSTARISEFVATLNKLAKLLEVESAAYNKLCEDRMNWIKEGMKIALSTRLNGLAAEFPKHEVLMVKAGMHLDDVKKEGNVVYINENTEIIHIQDE